jgi:hypothetical protein
MDDRRNDRPIEWRHLLLKAPSSSASACIDAFQQAALL